MKSVFVLLFVIATAIAQKSSINYDNVDVDMILKNNRVLTNYIKCVLGEGACTAEGRELKRVLPETLKNGCNKCDERQKTTAEKVFNHLRTKRPADWDRLTAKFDPKGEYKKRYDAQMKRKH